MRRILLSGSALAILAACSSDPNSLGFADEAGLTQGAAFGNATMNNVLVQSGQRDYAVSLGRRFAAEVPNTITFAFDSDRLDAEAQRILQAQAGFIRAFPEVRFAVYGHADAVGSSAYNYDLGLRRARAAVRYLVSQGVDASRLQALVSKGETQPAVASAGPERANRRAVTEVTGFVQGHPNVIEGRYAQIVYREYVGSAIPPSTLVFAPGQPAAIPSSTAGLPQSEGVAGGGGANGGGAGGG